MFDRIDDVQWAALEQAHGTAEHIPLALRGLMSSDVEIRNSSYWKLDNHVVLQSDLYQAAYFIIPFLLEILRSCEEEIKTCAYNLLHEIANGYAPDEVRCMHRGGEVSLVGACRAAIMEGCDLFLEDSLNSSSINADQAANLLSLLGIP
jgi:hypothetical protein